MAAEPAPAPAADRVPAPAPAADRAPAPRAATLPVQLLHDRVLVQTEADGERTSTGGILIPATAQVGRRLVWAQVVGVGPNVRTVEPGDRVLFDPEDPREVELHGATYVMLRERDVHAVASPRVDDASTGLYL